MEMKSNENTKKTRIGSTFQQILTNFHIREFALVAQHMDHLWLVLWLNTSTQEQISTTLNADDDPKPY